MPYCFQLVDVKKSNNGQESTDCCPASASKCLIIKPCGQTTKVDKSEKSGVGNCCEPGNCDSGDCVCIKLSALTESTCVMLKPGDADQKICVCVC
uniref:Uncharacterized protein n=1 Tax=Tetranychus urticae TaxID=32264 RepID=T1K7V0_TETUR